MRLDHPLWHGYRFTLLHRVKGGSPRWGQLWCAMEHEFAPICTHFHIYSIQNIWKSTKNNGKHVYMTYIYILRLFICIYDLNICIYGDIYPCIQPTLHIYIYIYIYIYMQLQEPKILHASHWRCRKLQSAWHNKIPKSSRSYCMFLSRNMQ